MVKAVPLHQKSLTPMQEKSMQDIFERIGIDEPCQKSGQEVQGIKRAPFERDQFENQRREDRTDQQRRDCVDALHPAGAGNFSRSRIDRTSHFRLHWLFYLDAFVGAGTSSAQTTPRRADEPATVPAYRG